MRHPFVAAVLLLVGSLMLMPFWAPGQVQDPWAPFRFLLGTWSATGAGQPGEVTAGTVSFAFDLDRKILVRKNRTELAPKPGEERGAVHEDLLIVYPQPGGGDFRAIYFDNEGHVIHYKISFPARQPAAVFESDGTAPGPRFRLSYAAAADGALGVEFAIAMPGGEFKNYLQGTMKPMK